MIQRIQTLYLFVTALLTSLLFFFPIASFDYGKTNMDLTILGVENQVDATFFGNLYTLPLLLLTIVLILMPLYISFCYKYRYRQIKLIQLDMLLTMIFIGLIFLYYSSNIQKTINSESVSYDFGIYVLLIDLLFYILAIRGIRKDIDLLKSADRLR